MLRERQRAVAKLHVIISAALILGTYWVLYQALRDGLDLASSYAGYLRDSQILAGLVMISLYVRRVSIVRRQRPAVLFRQVAICFLFGTVGFALISWLFKLPPLSRAFLLTGLATSYGMVMLWHLSSHWWFAHGDVNPGTFRQALVVGDAETLPSFVAQLRRRGVGIAGVVSIDAPIEVAPYPYLGTISSMQEILNARTVDCAVFLVYRQAPSAIEKALLACRERGIEVWMRPDFMQLETSLWQVDYLEGMPLLVFSLGPQYGWPIVLKRALDIVLSAAALMLLAVPMLIIAILVRISSQGPAIFKQVRVGLNGRRFVMYKFRTMFTGERSRIEKASLHNEMTGPVFKARNDPRITPLGRLLRKFSLDELPQLWNVFIGHMSLIGPRPPLVEEVDLYTGWQRRRLSMRPGLSCIWQVSGRNRIRDFEDWVRSDLYYIDNWSLWLDLVILVKTIGAVIRGTGY